MIISLLWLNCLKRWLKKKESKILTVIELGSYNLKILERFEFEYSNYAYVRPFKMREGERTLIIFELQVYVIEKELNLFKVFIGILWLYILFWLWDDQWGLFSWFISRISIGIVMLIIDKSCFFMSSYIWKDRQWDCDWECDCDCDCDWDWECHPRMVAMGSLI